MQSRFLLPTIAVLAGLSLAGCQERAQPDNELGTRNSDSVRGPDPIVLRIPRAGGSVRAYVYPQLDSVAWTGAGSSVHQVLGFDPEGGTLAVVNANGIPARIDLRLGEAAVATKAKLASLTSNGNDIYGVDAKGGLNRLTRVNDWTLPLPQPAQAIFPQLDGSVIVVAGTKTETIAWRVHPPMDRLFDTVSLALTLPPVRAQAGDRIYFGTDSGLVGFRTRDLGIVERIPFSSRVVSLKPTPSGDRLYVVTAEEHGVSVIDRYTDRVSTVIELPGPVSELRMDPLGRFLLARPAKGDSAWVIAVATDRVVGSVNTKWTDDLPASAQDGAIAISTGRDVVFVDGETLQPLRTIVDGAKDYWYFMFWNGFRPRAAGIDEPVSFGDEDSTALGDDGIDPYADPYATQAPSPGQSGTQPYPTPAPSAQPSYPPSYPPAAPTRPPTQPSGQSPAAPTPGAPDRQRYVVSFAAMLDETKARQLADSVIVNGVKARVMASQRAGTPIFRVVLGPYVSRAAADQVGRDSNRQFWVYPE